MIFCDSYVNHPHEMEDIIAKLAKQRVYPIHLFVNLPNMKITIINQVSELNRVRDFIFSVGAEYSFTEALTESLNLVLEEAVSNVIFYAYPKDKNHNIEIECLWQAPPAGKSDMLSGAVSFCIADTGVEFDPTAQGDTDVNLPVEDRDIGGLGIFIVKNIMDEVTYHRMEGRNELTLVKYVRKDQTVTE